jgi:DNA-binding SARP family transcriptional activator/tetratricopeptide (TPR) repeat protein
MSGSGWGGVAELRLLGPVELWVAGRPVDLGAPKRRGVLAALAVDAGRPVPLPALVQRVWDDAPPPGARGVLYTHLSAIRQLLRGAAAVDREAATLVRCGGGYLLDVDVDHVDLHRFRRLVDRAGRPGTAPAVQAALTRQALDLWRGPALADLSSAWAGGVREGWQQQRLAAARLWAQAELVAGRPAVVINELLALIAEYPLVEPLLVLLLRALHVDGRDAEALEQYHIARRRLVEELGVDPGAELRGMHAAILQGTLAAVGSPPVRPRPTAPDVPAQLPADVDCFTGRDSELRQLDALPATATDGQSTAVVISAVSGTAGVGKTALAVHWAHRVADRFPDGQLYVNLRGFDPGGQGVAPAEAVRGFLDALGVAPARIPAGLDARAALYRSVLAGKRVLVLVDNARDAEQARPLLPGTPTAFAVVTSRNQLTPLVAADGAHPLSLDVVTPAEARELLARRLGPDRLAVEPEAVDQIIAACARLPLALAIVAARARQSGFPLTALAAELTDAGGRLDALDAGDIMTQVRAVFSWSYTALRPAAARLFRLLGLQPGPDTSAAAAASLTGQPVAQVQPLLAELTRASLLVEHVPGRYACHDLLRAYAADLTGSRDTADQRRATLGRLLDHYLHTAHTADRILHPHRDPIPLPVGPPARGAGPEHLADHPQAMAWLTAEHPALLAALGPAADAGFDAHTWQLAWTLDTFLNLRGQWQDAAAAWQAALDTADRLGNPAARAYAHRLLGRACIRLGRYPDARAHHGHAVALYAQAGDRVRQAHTRMDLATLWERQDRPELALDEAQQALALYRAAGHRHGQAAALNLVGWDHALVGDYGQALACCRQALTLLQELGDRYGQACTWDSVGYAHQHLGNHTKAVDCFQHALDLCRDLGDRYYEGTVLTHLGDTYHLAGDPDAARDCWQRALTILTDLDHPDADTVHVKLCDSAGGVH